MTTRRPILATATVKTRPPTFAPVRRDLLQRKCACGGTPGPTGECEACRKKRLSLQRKAQRWGVGLGKDSLAPPVVHEVLRSPGQPLDADTRAFMETRFGQDFSRVRVHTDAKSAESARAVSALAYTVGNDIVLGDTQSSRGTTERNRLMAHELTHVVQQTQPPLGHAQQISLLQDEDCEIEATRIADAVDSVIIAPSHTVTNHSNANALLQRNGDGRERSRQSRPRNAPRGTVPIDQSGLDREDIHKIKDRIGAGPKDWVGVTPEGEVITTDEEGNAENHGPATDYLREAHPEIPSWVWALVAVIGILVVFAIVACFATGICEFGAVVAGLSYATALLVLNLLRRAGIRDSGGTAALPAEGPTESSEVPG